MRAALLVILGAFVPSLAAALTVSEASLPGGDFGDAFASRTELPSQTDEIVGSVFIDFVSVVDPDFVAFTDLVPGSTFSVIDILSFGAMDFLLQILDETGALVVPAVGLPHEHIGLPPIEVATGTVPASGQLVFGIFSSDLHSSYQLQLVAPRVAPEPGTALLLTLGLAALRARSMRGGGGVRVGSRSC
jgi:hypothetical protein